MNFMTFLDMAYVCVLILVVLVLRWCFTKANWCPLGTVPLVPCWCLYSGGPRLRGVPPSGARACADYPPWNDPRYVNYLVMDAFTTLEDILVHGSLLDYVIHVVETRALVELRRPL